MLLLLLPAVVHCMPTVSALFCCMLHCCCIYVATLLHATLLLYTHCCSLLHATLLLYTYVLLHCCSLLHATLLFFVACYTVVLCCMLHCCSLLHATLLFFVACYTVAVYPLLFFVACYIVAVYLSLLFFVACYTVVSVDSLPEELQEHFKMLTVFDYDTAIPLKVLETVWDVDDFDAEEHMNGNLCFIGTLDCQ